MTYCVGWKHQGAVFLLADAALTKLAEPSTDCSSFGELHGKVRGEHVEEALLKLVPVGKATAAGTAAKTAGASKRRQPSVSVECAPELIPTALETLRTWPQMGSE